MWSLLVFVVVFCLLSADYGAAGSQVTTPQDTLSQGDTSPTPFHEWQILETPQSLTLSFEDWLEALSSKDVIYVGEEHHNRFHVIAAVKILEALVAKDRRPAVALEMLSWDAQPALSRYLSGQTSKAAFLEEVRWEQTWGGPYEDYEPLITFARERHLPVLALNPPRSLVRRVASVGLAKAISDPETIGWGMGQEIPDDPRYGELISRQIRLCHAGLSEQGYQRMYEASIFRDEGMAKTIADYLRDRQPGDGPLLSYTGGGHIQYKLPVPNRVARRSNDTVRQTTVYLSAFESSRAKDIQELLREGIADYLWLTPLGDHGVPRRCG
jgi:uncharacterized iron-regulated protein